MEARLPSLKLLEQYDHVFGLGVKCNTAAARKRLGLQNYSSPFDNMDSVNGLRDIARVLSIGPEAYFGSKDKWIVRNDYGSRSTEVRTKILYHADYPGLFYPHFYSRWFDQSVACKLDEWIKNPKANLDLVWEGFSSTFSRRLNRLVNLLENGSKILFLRIDEINSLNRIYSSGNTCHDIEYFAEGLLKVGYTSCHLLYIYGYSDQFTREIPNVGFNQMCSQTWKAIGIRADINYDCNVSECLSSLFVDQNTLQE